MLALAVVPTFAAGRDPQGARVALEGTLEVLVEDHADQRLSRVRHFVVAGSERLELKSARQGPLRGLRSGTRLRVDGTKDGARYLNLDGSTGSVTTLATAPAPTTIGAQRTAVILVNFQDRPADRPWTADQVRSAVFGTVSNFYAENSFGNMWLTGNVFGWYPIAQASTSCDQQQIASSARAAATAAGVDVGSYARLVYVFPKTAACYWTGTASVGGTPSEAWINGELGLDVLAHEMGHNLGLHHSHASICSGATLGDACVHSEYGDTVDVMGGAKSAHFNAFQKEYLRWLNGTATPQIQTVSSSGTYTIGAYVGAGTHPKALKILKGLDATTGKPVYYYLEYRQPVGFDAPLGDPASMLLSAANVMNGVLVRTGSPDESGNTSFLLDMTPATYDSFYPRDPALVVGQTFTDSVAGVTISTSWTDAATAGVTVVLKQPGCTRANPVVALAPASQQAAAGGAVTYAVTVTNKDAAACGASTFNLQRTLPSGWTGSFASASLNVGAGGNASTTLTVTSPATATASTYPISIGAVNAASPSNSGTASGSYAVISSGISVTLSTDSAGYALGQTVRMATQVRSGGAPVVKAKVSFAITAPNGTLTTLAATTDASGNAEARYRLGRSDPRGVYRLTATSAVAGSVGSSSASFTVQ